MLVQIVYKATAVVGIAVLLLAGCQKGELVVIQVKQVEPLDSEILEEWVRVTDDLDILGVNAVRSSNGTWPWQVYVSATEFARSEPLEYDLSDAITNALNGVPGVTHAVREDREVWLVQGDVEGEALVRACAVVVDGLAERLRDLLKGS